MKLRFTLIQILVFSVVTFPLHAARIPFLVPVIEAAQGYVSRVRAPKHALVPDSAGVKQTRKNFELLFSGKEDPSTVRISTAPSEKDYTFGEKLLYLLTGSKPSSSSLSGTVISEGVITNAHGFFEEVPSLRNRILRLLGEEKRFYRPLVPVKIEQGLTLEGFSLEDEDLYYNRQDPSFQSTVHNVHTTRNIRAVFVSRHYVQNLRLEKDGTFFGVLDLYHDLALLKYNDDHAHTHVCQVAEATPSASKVRVRIYQYPAAHPLQKSSEEYAYFPCHQHPRCYIVSCEHLLGSCSPTHRCITLPGSSGSSLRDSENGEIIGIHTGGYARKRVSTDEDGKLKEKEEGNNFFTPLRRDTILEIDYKIYPLQ